LSINAARLQAVARIVSLVAPAMRTGRRIR